MTTTNTFLALCAAALIFSCSANKENETAAAPAGMHVLDLTRFGKPFSIFVPDTTASQLTISEPTSGALNISVGKNFDITVNEFAADIDLKKQDIKSDEVNRFKSFILEEPSGVIWESEITQPEHHFILNQKVGTSEYSFEDNRNPEAGGFGKEAIQKMYESCKNIQPLKKQEA